MGEIAKKHSRTLIVFLSVVNIVLSVITAADFMGFAGIAAFVFASALFACMILLTRSLYIFTICAPGFVLSLIFSKFSVISVVFGFAYIPAGLALYFSFRKKLMRTQIIVRLSATLSAVYILLIMLYFVVSSGGFSLKKLSDEIDEQTNIAVDYYFRLTNADATGETTESPELPESNAPPLSESDKESYVLSLKAVMPAMFIMYCNFISFFITSAFRVLYNNIIVGLHHIWKKNGKDAKKRKKISGDEWRINMSAISTVIFVAGLFFTMVLSNNTDNVIPVVVVTNILYILFPGIFMVGGYFLLGKLKSLYRKNVASFTAVIFLAIFVFVFSWVLTLMTVIFCGIYAIQVVEIIKLTEKIRKAFNRDDDDDYDDDF